MRIFEQHHLRFYRRVCHPVVVQTRETRFQLVGAEEFPWDLRSLSQHHAVYRHRFEAGGRALLGIRDQDTVFTAWIQQQVLQVDEMRWQWRLPQLDAVVYDVMTFEAWRGMGIYPLALRSLSGMLAEENVHHLWIYAERENIASLRGIEKADFEYRGSISAQVFAGVAFRSGRVKGVNA